MKNYVSFISILYFCSQLKLLKANTFLRELNGRSIPNLFKDDGDISRMPVECTEVLDNFAKIASNFTKCSIKHSQPVQLCEECIDQYVRFTAKYTELLETVINGTSCRSMFISHDRLDVVLEYHDSILAVWQKGNCNACYDWTGTVPVLSNNTIHFNKMFNETMYCIISNLNPAANNTDEVCERCTQSYVQLDLFYRSLSKDTVGLDSVCFDIIDSMNTTRSIWSKELNCCKLLRSPEIIFLCCTGIIAFLPILFYVSVRFCGPLRDLPRVLKESRFKQSFMQSSHRRIN